MSLRDVLLEDAEIRHGFECGTAFFQERDDALRERRAAVAERLDIVLRDFHGAFARSHFASEDLENLIQEACAYLRWLSWSLEDVIAVAAALELDPRKMARRIVSCHLVYQSGRIIDDIVDGHESYKGRRQTLLGARRRGLEGSGREWLAEKETLLVAVPLLMRGVRDYSACFGANAPVAAVHLLADSVSKACLGALVELSPERRRDKDRYEELVELKTTAHNSILLNPLFGVIEDDEFSRLRALHRKMSFLGQIFNDAADLAEDSENQQVNFFLLNAEEKESISFEDAVALRGELVDLLHEIERFEPRLREPCLAKFSTFVHAASPIDVTPEGR